jgi:hypothetical protein
MTNPISILQDSVMSRATILVLAALASNAFGQTLTLSPAVVPLRGTYGQSTTQMLTLTC